MAVSPGRGIPGEPITFDGSASYDPDAGGGIISWHWDFGDGTSGDGAVVSHAYALKGRFAAHLTVTDAEGLSAQAANAVIINHPPVPLLHAISTLEDTPCAAALAASDADGDALTFSIVSQPTKGYLSGNTYWPHLNANGNDSFTYRIDDGMASATATVAIVITPVNDPPVVTNLSAITTPGAAVAVTLVAQDPDSSNLSYAINSPAHGVLSGTAPRLTYTPSPGFTGNEVFTYTASDGELTSTPATVSVFVNSPPVPTLLAVTTQEDTACPMVLSASDVDGDALSYSWWTYPTRGTLSGTAPNLTYTPALNWNGSDSFSYRISDGVNTVIGTVAITITPVNDAPVASSVSVFTNIGTAVTVTLKATDVDSTVLSYRIVDAPANGSLSGTAPSLTYMPNPGFAGTDTFTYTASDGSLTSAMATATMRVNRPPVAQPMNVTVRNNTITPITLMATDADGQALTYRVTVNPTRGMLSGTAPNLNYLRTGNPGADNLTFVANDGYCDSAPATVTLNLVDINPWPEADLSTVPTAGTVSFTLFGNGFGVSGSGGLDALADAGHFTWTDLPEDGRLSARVTGLGNAGTTARGGLMVRAGNATDSPMAGLLLTSTGHLEWRQRTASAVPAISTDLGAQTLPCWLRLARTADGVEASRSTDGRTWTVVASAAVVLPATARAGLWAGSGTAGLARLDADQVCVHHTHATEWPTLGASASRSGFRSGGFAGTPFTQTWSIATGSKLNPACVGNGLVFVTSNIYFASGWLKAYDASTGALVWTQAFASPYVINPPAFAEGRVFVQWCNASSGQFSGFSAITGMPLWQSPYATQFGRYAAACPADGAVFVNGGAYGGMYGFEQAGGTQRFFSSLAQYDQWAPAFADGALYSWVGGVLRAHTPATGALTWSVDCNAPVTGGSINSVPVIAEGCAVLRSNGVLCAVDLATRIKRWSVNIPTTYNVYNVPAVDQGTVFALTGNQLKSYSLASGSPLLSFTATAPLIDQPLVTADSVIVTSANAAWILDRSTFAVRQSLSAGGHATLSGRTLHLADDAGNLRAFTAPVATPTITPDGGAFTTPQQVAITDATCDAVIRYTLDGSAPTRTATPYGTPITIASGTTVLKAAAFTTTAQSPIATATFTVNTAPTVALAAAATPDPVTGTTAMLTILGADDAGEVPLTYTWEAVDAPPAAVTFNANGTNAAKSTMAGFILPGGYSFQCTIRDAGGLAVTSRVTVLVARTPTTVVVSPAVATLRTSQVQPFTATVQDQFGTLMDPPPAIAWSPASLPGGTLDATGLFTANTSPGGPYTLTATVGGASGTATVTVLLPDTLPVITAQPANLTVAVGQTATFLVVATGNPAPAYQWQRSNDGGSNWSDIVGATTASCTTPVLALADDLARFRCTVANTVGSVTCNAAVLNVVNAGITREYWTGITGTAVSAIPLASIPAGIQLLTSFEAPTSFADNYGARVRGCLCPTVSGAYQFWIASDDNSELWLSTTASSANKVRIAYLSGWASARQWTKYTTQASAAINLVAGQRYYIEALHKEGGGGDSLAVAWQCTAAGITQQVIPGAVLMPYGTLPSVTSGAVSGITATAAVVAGTVTADGGTAVYRGVCYGTVANPTITGGKVACGTGAGVFSATLTGLVQGTVHYARAYATNGAGTVYGGQVAFTTAVPPAISLHPVGQTAVVGSTATFTVTATGSPAPTYQWYRSNDQGTNWSVITGATGASYTTAALVITDDYAQFRCTAANSGGTTTSNGAVLNVINAGITREYWTGVAGSTVATVPVATTPSGIQLLTSCEGPTSFADNYGTRVRGYLVPTVSGSYRFWIASDDSSELWLSTDATTTNKARIAYVNGYSSSRQWTKFATQASVAITLVAGQSYYLEALHKEGGGGDNLAVAWQCTAAGIAQQVIPGVVLRPVGIQPRVATGSVASIAVASASVAGNVLADGGSTVLRGICYGLAPNPTITGSKVAGGNGVGTFTATLNGLSAGTLYHVRAYATNAAGTVYGADATFTTLADTVPTVTTSVAAHITDSTADCGGTITVSSGLAVTERGVCWSLVPTPTIAGSRTIDGSGTGAFTSVMTGLEANTTYYVRAYATNAIGTGYGEQVTFTTLVPEPPVPTVIGQVRTWDDDRLTPGDPKPGTWAGQRIAHLVPSTFDHIIARGQVFTRDDDRTAQ